VIATHWDWGLGLGVLGVVLVVILIAALFIGAVNWRRDPNLRQIRFGVFLDRERFDPEPLEKGWDEDDTVEIEPLRYQKKYPPEKEDK